MVMENLLRGISVFLVSVVIALIIGLFLDRLDEHFKKKKNALTDIIIDAMNMPIRLVIIFIGLDLGALFAFPNFIVLGVPVNHFLVVIVVIIAAFIFTRIIRGILKWYSHEIVPKSETKINEQALRILSRVISIFIYAAAFIGILHYFGFELTPALAGLGVAGIAIALALQPTLSNLFSGISVLSDRAVRVGDLIEIDGSEVGTVMEVGWRSIRIKTFQNNLITIPNSKLADSRVKNYSLPSSPTSDTFEFGVSYDSDLDKVEKVLQKITKKVLKENPEVIDETFEPLIRFSSFNESSINVKVIYRTKTYTGKFLIKHNLIKEIKKTFKKEKIDIPYPIRTVKLKK